MKMNQINVKIWLASEMRLDLSFLTEIKTKNDNFKSHFSLFSHLEILKIFEFFEIFEI